MTDKTENIRVFVRVRPPFSSEHAKESIVVEGDRNVRLKYDKYDISCKYNKVFDKESSQDAIFAQITPLLIDTLNGVNCSVLAYGQTSAGKTHTMLGPDGGTSINAARDSNSWGILPRSVFFLFDELRQRVLDDGVKYQVKISYMQIYNEIINDLLREKVVIDEYEGADAGGEQRDTGLRIREYTEGPTATPSSSTEQLVQGQQLTRNQQRQEIFVSGLSEFRAETAEDVLNLLLLGSSNRSTRSTECNSTSSRSHAILQLTFEIESQADDGQTIINRSKLSFVDLAGSEKIISLGNDKDPKHLKELTSINKSLSSLGNVIAALAKGRPHIPYRNSKLTRLLQDSLGGNTRTLLIACVAPTAMHAAETFNTLQFADRASSVMVRVRPNVVIDDKALLVRAQVEVARLKRLLRFVMNGSGGSMDGGGGGGPDSSSLGTEHSSKQSAVLAAMAVGINAVRAGGGDDEAAADSEMIRLLDENEALRVDNAALVRKCQKLQARLNIYQNGGGGGSSSYRAGVWSPLKGPNTGHNKKGGGGLGTRRARTGIPGKTRHTKSHPYIAHLPPPKQQQHQRPPSVEQQYQQLQQQHQYQYQQQSPAKEREGAHVHDKVTAAQPTSFPTTTTPDATTKPSVVAGTVRHKPDGAKAGGSGRNGSRGEGPEELSYSQTVAPTSTPPTSTPARGLFDPNDPYGVNTHHNQNQHKSSQHTHQHQLEHLEISDINAAAIAAAVARVGVVTGGEVVGVSPQLSPMRGVIRKKSRGGLAVGFAELGAEGGVGEENTSTDNSSSNNAAHARTGGVATSSQQPQPHHRSSGVRDKYSALTPILNRDRGGAAGSGSGNKSSSTTTTTTLKKKKPKKASGDVDTATATNVNVNQQKSTDGRSRRIHEVKSSSEWKTTEGGNSSGIDHSTSSSVERDLERRGQLLACELNEDESRLKDIQAEKDALLRQLQEHLDRASMVDDMSGVGGTSNREEEEAIMAANDEQIHIHNISKSKSNSGNLNSKKVSSMTGMNSNSGAGGGHITISTTTGKEEEREEGGFTALLSPTTAGVCREYCAAVLGSATATSTAVTVTREGVIGGDDDGCAEHSRGSSIGTINATTTSPAVSVPTGGSSFESNVVMKALGISNNPISTSTPTVSTSSSATYPLHRPPRQTAANEPARLVNSELDVGRCLQMYSFRYDSWDLFDIVAFNPKDGLHKCVFHSDPSEAAHQWVNLKKKPVRGFAPDAFDDQEKEEEEGEEAGSVCDVDSTPYISNINSNRMNSTSAN